MRGSAPADLWDWHWYASAPEMFAGRTVFDGSSHANNGSIYASEYAVFDWGIETSPVGNLQVLTPQCLIMVSTVLDPVLLVSLQFPSELCVHDDCGSP